MRTIVFLLFTVTNDHFCRFSASLDQRNPDHPEYTSALELKDELDFDERSTIVAQVLLPFCMSAMLPAIAGSFVLIDAHVRNQAIRRFRVTLMTRAYGRGTDFVCRDSGLVQNGQQCS